MMRGNNGYRRKNNIIKNIKVRSLSHSTLFEKSGDTQNAELYLPVLWSHNGHDAVVEAIYAIPTLVSSVVTSSQSLTSLYMFTDSKRYILWRNNAFYECSSNIIAACVVICRVDAC